MSPKVYFRADGNAQIGLGHVYRSLALAEMLSPDFDCKFIIQSPTNELSDEIKNTCSETIVLPKTEDFEKEANEIRTLLTAHDAIVLDGYNYNTTYQEIIRSTGCKLIAIDDLHENHFLSHILINQASGVDESLYSKEPYTKLLLGTEYVLLRKPFLNFAKSNRKIEKKNNKALICIGGSDYFNITLKVLGFTTRSNLFDEIVVVVGSSYSALDQLEKFVSEQKVKVELHVNKNALEMVELLSTSSVAICPASTVAYEICSVRTSLICGYYTENQKLNYEGFVKNGVCIGVGDLNSLEEDELIKAIYLLKDSTVNERIERNQIKLVSGNSDITYKKIFKELW